MKKKASLFRLDFSASRGFVYLKLLLRKVELKASKFELLKTKQQQKKRKQKTNKKTTEPKCNHKSEVV